MIREMIKIGIDQIAGIEIFYLVVKYRVDKIIEVGQGMNKIIGITVEEEILEVM